MSAMPDLPLEGIYGEAIRSHHRNPHHFQPLSAADLEAEGFNPFCGDGLKLQLKLDQQGCVAAVGCPAQGCSIIRASASMMSDAIQGKTLAELEQLSRLFHQLMQGTLAPEDEPAAALGELKALHAVRRYPVRIKCVLLPWATLEEGIETYRANRENI